MLAKALFRQTVNSARVVMGTSSRGMIGGVARQMVVMSGVRGFSTNTAAIEKSIQKLNKSLEKEIKYENENYSQLDDIETYLNESGFKFTEEEGGVVLTLSKSVGDKVVEVQFEAR